jgi:protein-S-isoprenylcysteine O-methyltransferase Ste14
MNFKILSKLIAIIFTIISVFISYISRLENQDLILWASVDIIILNNWFIGVNLTLFTLIHILIGAIIFYISFYQCIEIVELNNQVHESKNSPKKLIDYDYYAIVRHPMTSRFLSISTSFFFMLGSLIGIPLIIIINVLFYFFTLIEEKRILIPIFGDEYQTYKRNVKEPFFGKKMKIWYGLLIIFMLIGVFFI